MIASQEMRKPSKVGPCRDYDPMFKLHGCELGAGHTGPHRDRNGYEWDEHLPAEPGRCDSHAPWGSGWRDQRCVLDSGHRGQHRDRSGNKWSEPEGSGTPSLPPLTLAGLKDTVLNGDPGCLCDPELFTGPSGIEPEDEPPDEKAARITVAREVCASCPVRLACLAYALRTRPAAGVWAGWTADELAYLGEAARRRPVKQTPAGAVIRGVA